jgi:hypothetical protein
MSKRKIAFHEASHAIVAYKMGDEIKHVTMVPNNNGRLGYCRIKEPKELFINILPNERINNLWKDVVCSLAGCFAETKIKTLFNAKKSFIKYLENNGDFHDAIEDLDRIRRIHKLNKLKNKSFYTMGNAWKMSVKFCEDNKKLISKIANELLRKRFLRSNQFLSIVKSYETSKSIYPSGRSRSKKVYL